MIPTIEFRTAPLGIHYKWVNGNPSYSAVSKYTVPELSTAVAAGAAGVEAILSGRHEQLMVTLTRLTGYRWREDRVMVYPTFLWPSFAQPLSLKTVTFEEGRLVPISPALGAGILVHELVHQLVPPSLFLSREVSERVADIVALRTMQLSGIDSTEYAEFSSETARRQARYPEPGFLSVDEVLSPTVRDFIERRTLRGALYNDG